MCFSCFGPHTKEQTMVQRRAARWTTNDLNRTTSFSSLLHQLNWQTLEKRQSVTRLCLFYKIVYGLVAMPLPHYIDPVVRPSRCNSMNFDSYTRVWTTTNIPSFAWPSCRGTPSQNMSFSLLVLSLSRPQ